MQMTMRHTEAELLVRRAIYLEDLQERAFSDGVVTCREQAAIMTATRQIVSGLEVLAGVVRITIRLLRCLKLDRNFAGLVADLERLSEEQGNAPASEQSDARAKATVRR